MGTDGAFETRNPEHETRNLIFGPRKARKGTDAEGFNTKHTKHTKREGVLPRRNAKGREYRILTGGRGENGEDFSADGADERG